jgi:hypothetical protein
MDLSAALGPEGLAGLLSHPALIEAGDAVAEANVRSLTEMDDETRWLSADLGRTSLCGSLLMLDALPMGATAAGLMAAAAATGACSRGRVVSFLQYAQARGRVSLPSGHEAWTQRRLVVSDSFHRPFRRLAQSRLRGMSPVAPELAGAADRFEDPAIYKRFLVSLAMMMGSQLELFSGPRSPITLFMERHGGMDILRDMTRGQPPGRARLLEGSPLSRSGLARRNNVSRTQVMRLLADAEAAGLLTARSDRVSFAPALSDDAERHLAFTVQTARLAVAQTLG